MSSSKGISTPAPVEQLKAAVDLSPENLLAHQLIAECYFKLDRPIETLMPIDGSLFKS